MRPESGQYFLSVQERKVSVDVCIYSPFSKSFRDVKTLNLSRV
jgi:hypothetical protein